MEKPNVRFHDGQILSEEPLNKAMEAVDYAVEEANKVPDAVNAASSAAESASATAASAAAIYAALEAIMGSGDIPAATIAQVAENTADISQLDQEMTKAINVLSDSSNIINPTTLIEGLLYSDGSTNGASGRFHTDFIPVNEKNIAISARLINSGSYPNIVVFNENKVKTRAIFNESKYVYNVGDAYIKIGFANGAYVSGGDYPYACYGDDIKTIEPYSTDLINVKEIKNDVDKLKESTTIESYNIVDFAKCVPGILYRNDGSRGQTSSESYLISEFIKINGNNICSANTNGGATIASWCTYSDKNEASFIRSSGGFSNNYNYQSGEVYIRFTFDRRSFNENYPLPFANYGNERKPYTPGGNVGLNEKIKSIDDSLTKVNNDVTVLNNIVLSGIPNVYKDYIAQKEAMINESVIDKYKDSFVFYTDTHWGGFVNGNQSKSLIVDILRNTLIDKAFWGGDSCLAYDSVERMNSSIKTANSYAQGISQYAKYLPMQGNHDFHTNADGTKYGLNQAKTRSVLFANSNKKTFNPSDPNSTYYYYDEENSGIRYFVFQTSHNGDVDNTQEVITVSDVQLDFFANAALSSPKDWNIIALGHCPCTKATDGEIYVYAIADLLSAINNKSIFSRAGKTYNFSSNTNHVLAYISGHTHTDLQTYYNNVLHITTASDGRYTDNCHSPYFKNVKPRGYSAVTSYNIDLGTDMCLFDVMLVKEGCIDIKRIGAYFDRKYNTDVRSINVGSSVTLTTSLQGNVTWHCFDNTITYKGMTQDPTTGYCTSEWNGTDNSNIVSVSNGNVTANSTGYAMVFAMDENQTKEFWCVKVS